MKNPYVQVALTYVRRPFASPRSRLLSVLITFALAQNIITLILAPSEREVGRPLQIAFRCWCL